MDKTVLIRYNDSIDYEYITCLSAFGVFTNSRVDPASLPKGFFPYYLTVDADGVVDKTRLATVTPTFMSVFGTFISKTPVSRLIFQESTATDWATDVTVHTDMLFHFEEFFGTKPSIDCQISNAERRRDFQIREAKEKKKRRGRGGEESISERGGR